MNSPLLISYLALRKTIGILGLLLPFLVSLGAWLIFHTHLQESLSAYYYTGTGSVFVGSLWAIGFFLFSYKGYERRDDIAGDLACVFALGVSLFPCNSPLNIVHFVCAALLFLTLSYFSLFLFTKTDPTKKPTRQKLQRNWVYKGCGYIMLVCIGAVPVTSLVPAFATVKQEFDLLFWLEAIMIVAFGISWLVKGEAILADVTPDKP